MSEPPMPPKEDNIATTGGGKDETETWERHADKYDEMVGNVTLQAADALINFLETKTDFKDRYTVSNGHETIKIIELGSGTGSLAIRLLARYPDVDLLATDSSPNMLAQLKRKFEMQSAQPATQDHGQVPTSFPPTASVTQIRDQQSTDPVPTSSNNRLNLHTAVLDMTQPSLPSILDPASAFDFVLSLCAIQSTPSCLSALQTAYQLTANNGWCILGIWDFTGACAPHDVWRRAVRRVDRDYVEPRIVPAPQWLGRGELEEGMQRVGFQGVAGGSVRCRMVGAGEVGTAQGGSGRGGAGVAASSGTEAFMRWFWQSGNPMPANRLSTFHGDREALKVAMRDVLDEEFDHGRELYIDVGFAVGRKSSSSA